MAVLALTLAGQAAGATAGGLFGIAGLGGSIGGALGSALGNYLFNKPPDTQGPRVNDIEVFTASEGAAIPYSWGTRVVPGQVVWAPKLQEKSRKTKTGGKGLGGGGGTHKTYYNQGSWAVSFGYNRSGVPRILRRVWANKKLAYDATSGDGQTYLEGFDFTYYDGTQTEADSTMEAEIGVGNVPAYTGQALLVFSDLDLESFGNQHPQIEAELVDNGTSTPTITRLDLREYGYDEASDSIGHVYHDTVNGLVWMSFNGANSGDYAAVFGVNPWTKKPVFSLLLSADVGATNQTGPAILMNTETLGDKIAVYRNIDTVERFGVWQTNNFQSLGNSAALSGTITQDTVRPLFTGVAWESSGGVHFWDGTVGTADETSSAPSGYVGPGWKSVIVELFTDDFGTRAPVSDEVYGFFEKTTSGSGNYGLFSLSVALGGTAITFVQVVSSYASVAPSESVSGFNMPNGEFIDNGIYVEDTDSIWFPFSPTVGTDVYLIELDKDDGSVLAMYNMTDRSGIATWSNTAGLPLLSYDSVTRSIWYSAAGTTYSFNVITQESESFTGNPGGAPIYYHSPGGYAIGLRTETGSPSFDYDQIWFHRVNNIDQNGIAVSSVIKDAITHGDIGVPASSVVFSGVSATVTGAGTDDVAPVKELVNKLLQYAYADGFESEYALKFVGRGAAVATTLVADYLGAIDPGSQPNPVATTPPHGIELPKSVDVRYFNAGNGHQVGDAHFEWHVSNSNRRVKVDLPVSISATQAIQTAQKFLFAMAQKEQYQFSTGPYFGQIEPTDIVTLPTGTRTERVRIEQVRRGVNGVREITAVRDSQEDATSSLTAAGGAIRDDAIKAGGGVFTHWLDTPALQDSDVTGNDHPGPYVAVYDYASGFPVGFLYTSPDNASYVEVAQFDDEPAWGIVQDQPSDISDFGVWDTINTLTIDFQEGATDLESTTSAAVFAGGNAAAWGRPGCWEIVQYLSVAVASSGARQISSLLRGRRGSDANVNSHEASDFFVVLDSGSLSRLTYAVGDIDSAVYTRAIRPAQSYADVTPAVFSVTKTALQPYSPISTVVATASGGDINGSWTRRTRAGGSYVGLYDNVGGPVQEQSEQWQVDVINPATGSVVVSNAIATTSSNFVYTLAAQTSDSVNSLGTISFKIFQISAAVGRGTPASVTFDKGWEVGLSHAVGLGVDHYITLSDAGTANMVDIYGTSVGVWQASTGVASGEWLGGSRNVVASINADSSTSTGIIGSFVHDWADGKKEISIAVWADPDQFSGGKAIMLVPASATDTGLELRISGDTPTFRFAPAGGTLHSISYQLDSRERLNPTFITCTANTSTSSMKLYVGGEEVASTTYSSAVNPINWGTYVSTGHPGRLFARGNGTGDFFTGKAADLQLYPRVLSAAEVSTLFIKQNGYQDRIEDLGATNYWSLDYRTDSSTHPDLIGNADIDFAQILETERPVHKCVRYGADIVSNNYAYASLVNSMRTQIFSIEAWVEFEVIGTNQPWLTFWPAGANASAKGVQFLIDSTNGIRARYSENGDGTWRYLNASATTSVPYHVVLTKASAGAAPTLYVNAVATTGASAFAIDWADASGTVAPPRGTIYFNRANVSTTASVAPDVQGARGWHNSVAFYASTVLTSVQVASTYSHGLKQL